MHLNENNIICYTWNCALLWVFWIFRNLSSGKRKGHEAHKVKVSQKNGWIKQNKCNDKTDFMSYCLAFCNSAQNTMFYCHGNTTLLHSPLKNTKNPRVQACHCRHGRRGSSAFHINKLIFVSLSIKFILLWLSSRKNTRAVYCECHQLKRA